MDEAGVAKVVETIAAEDLGASLEPHTLIKSDAVLGEDLWGHAAEGAKHSPAGMDDLNLTVATEGLGIGREASRVPAVVTRELTIEVRGSGILREGAQELGTVRAIPHGG
jgi:hypothetical protein